tara:strand:+ start:3098 stop:3391 length:294 start_codon:yes stop_codon:yes gene_type:complete
MQLLACEAPFCTGWYVNGTTPMVARWNETTFLTTGHMDFVSKEELEQSKESLLKVSYCGFRFTKTSTELFKGLSKTLLKKLVLNTCLPLIIYCQNYT